MYPFVPISRRGGGPSELSFRSPTAVRNVQYNMLVPVGTGYKGRLLIVQRDRKDFTVRLFPPRLGTTGTFASVQQVRKHLLGVQRDAKGCYY